MKSRRNSGTSLTTFHSVICSDQTITCNGSICFPKKADNSSKLNGPMLLPSSA